MPHVSKLIPPPRCREVLRLRRKFSVKNVEIEHGLHDHLVAANGSTDDAGFLLGRLIHRHACGVYGAVSRCDRLLNDHVLKEAALRGSRHFVVSQHRAGPLVLNLATDLSDGATTIRMVTPQGIQQAAGDGGAK